MDSDAIVLTLQRVDPQGAGHRNPHKAIRRFSTIYVRSQNQAWLALEKHKKGPSVSRLGMPTKHAYRAVIRQPKMHWA